ncbi:AraC family ligand binding domain-containing protein [Lachnospiraceae bacterium 54-53]
MQNTKILTDESMMELIPHGCTAFPFQYYYEDVGKFDNRCIDWHWHREFELVLVTEGNVQCSIGNTGCILEAGDGIFINSSLSALCFLCENPTNTWELDAHALLSRIWSVLFEHRQQFENMENSGINRISQAHFRRMTCFIEQNYWKKITLEDIAMSVGVSSSFCIRAVPLPRSRKAPDLKAPAILTACSNGNFT